MGIFPVHEESDLEMDLRSIKPGMVAVPLFLYDAKSGRMFTPLGYTKSGSPIWPVAGGAPDDDDGTGKDDKDEKEDPEEEDEDPDEDVDDEDPDDDEDEAKGKKKKGNPEAKIKALEEEKDRHFKKFKAQKKRADDLESRLKALEDKDLKPEERETRAKEEQDRRDQAAAARMSKLNLENAFLKANEIDWVKPEQALAILLADPDEYEVEFDEDGKVDRKSLRVELKRLAKANPHLVKPKKTESKGDDQDGDEGGSAQRATASSMNGKRKGKKDQPSREQLAKKFPALGRLS
jgi:hypothetical protein